MRYKYEVVIEIPDGVGHNGLHESLSEGISQGLDILEEMTDFEYEDFDLIGVGVINE